MNSVRLAAVGNLLWGRTRAPALLGTPRFWKASTYRLLTLDDVRSVRSVQLPRAVLHREGGAPSC